MIKFFRSLVGLLVCCFIFSQLGLQNKKKREVVDGVAAVVETDVILKSDAVQQSYMLAEQRGINPGSSSFEVLYQNVLDQMINNLVLYHLSLKDTNIVVDNLLIEQTLKKEIEKRVEFAGSVSSLEEMFGEPLSMIRSKLRLEIRRALRVELFTSSIYQSTFPSSGEVRSFYNTYKDSLPLLEDRVSLAVLDWPVLINQEKEGLAVSFLQALKDSVELFGENFHDLASKYSDDVGSAQNGGRLGFVVRGSLFPEYESTAFGLSVGSVSAPFKTDLGYHLVFLEDRLGEKVKTSHILKLATLDENDVKNSRNLFEDFLSENFVYNYVNKFDSLCVHFNEHPSVLRGVYRSVPTSSLPPFLQTLSLDSLGFHPLITHDNTLFLVRVFDFKPSGPASLEGYYSELEGMVKNKLIGERLDQLVNKGYKKLYIKKYY